MRPRHTGWVLLSLILSSSTHGLQFDFKQCQKAVTDPKSVFGSAGTTDRYGNLRTENSAPIEGYQYKYCLENCGSGSDLSSFDTIQQQFAVWFLPWLSLLAQLPFFASGKIEDFFIAIYTIGSPTTALYGLFLTILNRKWLKEECDAVRAQSPFAGCMLANIAEVLGSLQQFPIQISNAGLLVTTFANARNLEWWAKLQVWFVSHRRQLEASAYAQLLLAVIVYGFALVEAFLKLGGTP
jgi:hypothetical protein